MEKETFESVLKEKLGNHELPVNPALWKSVSAQAGLSSGGAGLGLVIGATPVVGQTGTALVGGYLGGKIQEAIMPMTTEERAKASFTEANRSSRYAKLTGEIAPMFVTGGKMGAVKALAGGVIGGGIEVTRQAMGPDRMDLGKIGERAVQGAVAAQSKAQSTLAT
jgi:hypothetical protein